MRIDPRPISNMIGVMLTIVGILMLCIAPMGFYYIEESHHALLKSGLITLGVGLILWFYKFKQEASIRKREGYLIVFLGWMAMLLFSTLPYVFSGVLDNYTDAWFETMSGMTTTGATIMTDIESMPLDIILWRSMTQWIGGMGIIVLTVAIFPLLGFGGIELFVAEAPGPTSDKIHPRIQETAKRLWLIYLGLTLLLFGLLWVQGMTPYDAICHTLTCMSTGGFSPKNASIAHYTDASIQYTFILFMFIAGTNYTVLYLMFKNRWKKVLASDEYRGYIIFVLIISIVTTIVVYNVSGSSLEQSFREATFMAVSIITTTGYVTADYTSWSPGLTILFFGLIFVGGCAGSTAGGIKIIRHVAFLKNTILEFKRLMHPNAVIPLKLNGSIVKGRIKTHILVFLLLYLGTFILGSVIVAFFGLDFTTSMGAVATSISNVGPAIGDVGPVNNFAHLPATVKWILSALMLLGRLELYTILILFTGYFWRFT